LRLELALGGAQTRVHLLGGVGAPAEQAGPKRLAARRSDENLGASGIASRTWRAPWTSISRTTGSPRRRRPSSSERRVP
jgi:hypothetical protein